jgi:Family of unknown function (DUF5681)
MSETIDNAQENRGRFKPGQSGNPKGKPRGKTRKTILKERLSKGDLDAIVKALVDKAKGGDTQAAAILMNRVWPAPKPAGRFLSFNFPTGLGLAGIATAFDAIMAAVGTGALTTEEATGLAAILEKQAKILEVDETQRRLAAIEAKLVEQQQPRRIAHG